MSYEDKKYHFVYLTCNAVNGKEYIGIHSTDNLEDGYLGSGHALIKAIKKYGKKQFYKAILSVHSTRQDALNRESELVNRRYVLDKNTYNLTIGGQADPVTSVWENPNVDIEAVKKKISKRSSGYENADFVKNWAPVYERIAPFVCFYSCFTNLPDRFIRRVLNHKLGCSIKMHRVLKYYEHKKYLDIQDTIVWRDYFGSGYIPNQKAVKTVCNSLYDTSKFFINYKVLHMDYFNDFSEMRDLLDDMTISDSMLINDRVGASFGKGVGSRIKYFQMLGILTEGDKIKIDIRKWFPESQRRHGIKTIYNFVPIKDLLVIENEGDYNEYRINYDGSTIQKTRVPDRVLTDWRIS